MLDPVELELLHDIRDHIRLVHRELEYIQEVIRTHDNVLKEISKNTHDSNRILNEEVTEQEPSKWWKKPFGLF